jgi:superfamily II DNA helicase RecQ
MDNPTIRRVVIYNVGKNAFDLWQKIGRACRDGKRGEAIIMVRGRAGGGMFTKGVCIRHCILSKLMGYNKLKTVSLCKCKKSSCECSLCCCCEVCVLKCSCNQKPPPSHITEMTPDSSDTDSEWDINTDGAGLQDEVQLSSDEEE